MEYRIRRRIGIKNKKGFDLAFSWVFAIIAGSVLLFLAIFAAGKVINISKDSQYAEAAKSLSILYEPLQSVAEGQLQTIKFNRETKVIFDCQREFQRSSFGRQTIAITKKSGIGKEWAAPGPAIPVYNKFLFSDREEQGTKLYVFSKPYYLGYKVADVITTFSSSEKYCFVAPPTKIERDIESLGLPNINVTNSITFCEDNSKKVCFGFSHALCGVSVFPNSLSDYEVGRVEKQGIVVHYTGNLIYPAIFSDPRIYECNVERIAKKAAGLGMVYLGKIDLVKVRGCDSIIGNYLNLIVPALNLVTKSSDLVIIYNAAKEMDEQNKEADCRIYNKNEY